MDLPLAIRLDGHSAPWLARARALVRDAGHREWLDGEADPPDVVLAEVRLTSVPAGAMGVVAPTVGDGLRRRLEALLRRPARIEVSLADGWIDLVAETVVRGETVPLTAIEAALLRRLLRVEGQTVDRADLLRDVWGVGPRVQTRALDTAVRRLRAKIEGDRRRPTHLLTAHGIGYRFVPAPATGATPPSNLGPPDDEPFVGREVAMAALDRGLRAGRWVTIVGPGGMGKTRLARHFARRANDRRRPGGVWFCDLSEVDDLDGATAAAAAALGAVGAPSAHLGGIMRARGGMLLVLDDADRVAPVLGPTISAWLDAAPDLAVVVTSRRATGHINEIVCEPGPLETADAIALFRRRARLDPDPAIEALVEAIDRQPLAITLIAERARMLRPKALLDRLRAPESHVRLLSRPGDDGRHGAVDRVLADSWALSSPAQRRVARRCAVFRGGFTVASAEAVCATPETIDALQSLLDLCIVRRLSADRLGFFETIRCWLTLRLDDAGEADATRARHRSWCVALARRFAAAPYAEQARLRPTVTAERHNLRAALDGTVDPDDRAALAIVISTTFARTGPFAVAEAAVEQDPPGADRSGRARLACARARHAVRQGRPDAAWVAIEPALLDAERGDDTLPPRVRADVLIDAARCAPDPPRSLALAEAADAVFLGLGDRVGRGAARMIRARVEYRAGRPDVAMGHALWATDAYREAQVDDLLAPALANLALTFMLRSKWPESTRLAIEARQVARRIDDPATESIGIAIDGYIAMHNQAFDEAAEYLDDAVRRQRQLALRGVRLQNQLLAGLAHVLAGRLTMGREIVDGAGRDARVDASPSLNTVLRACSAALAALAGEQTLATLRATEARTGETPRAPAVVGEATRLFLAVVDAADDHGRASQILADADVRATTELTVKCARWLLARRLSPMPRRRGARSPSA